MLTPMPRAPPAYTVRVPLPTRAEPASLPPLLPDESLLFDFENGTILL